MIVWFRHLPKLSMDLSEWVLFIQNSWFRKHFMKFVYLLQIIIFLAAYFFNTWSSSINLFALILIGIIVFIIHEVLHIVVIHNKGDISLTFRGTFFWLHTNAVLTKMRFWVFMSLPLLVLSGVPAVISFYVSGNFKAILLFVTWLNL